MKRRAGDEQQEPSPAATSWSRSHFGESSSTPRRMARLAVKVPRPASPRRAAPSRNQRARQPTAGNRTMVQARAWPGGHRERHTRAGCDTRAAAARVHDSIPSLFLHSIHFHSIPFSYPAPNNHYPIFIPDKPASFQSLRPDATIPGATTSSNRPGPRQPDQRPPAWPNLSGRNRSVSPPLNDNSLLVSSPEADGQRRRLADR